MRRPHLLTAVVLAVSVIASGCTASTTARPPRPDRLPAGRGRAARSAAPGRTSQGLSSRVIVRDIPGTRSRFPARRAYIYLPPILRREPRRRLPVLELLHGSPGGPSDWLVKGDARSVLDRFARAHGGLAPIVVMPDINAADQGDTECVPSAHGDVETYLTKEVPAYLATHFPVATGRRGWAIAGPSEGGTCSVLLVLRNADRFASFVDMSGLAHPTVGEHDDPARTIATLFGGSRAAYLHHDPVWLLGHFDYPSVAGWFVSGAQDAEALTAEHELIAASRAAHLAAVVEDSVPGKHYWLVWTAALRRVLPWLWRRMTS
ncbi:MAG: alpha/beta hydrolase [Jatrophihabitantaceae bacterium]